VKPKLHSNIDVLDIGSPGNLLLSSLASTLRQGLDNRVKAVAVLRHSSVSRPLTQALPFTPSTIQIGLILDSEHAFRLVDYGPSAEDLEDNSSFRNFWGEDKAELRRFKDGRILECVVWDVKTVDEKARIPGLIVMHILGRHFGVDGSTVIETWQSSFDTVLRLPSEVSGIYDRFSPKIGFKTAMVAFDALAKRIKELPDLPLAILTISPVSDQLRYTGVFSPVAIPTASMGSFPQWMRYLPVMEVIIEFEKSTKWPDDLRAIQKMKLAFFEQIARSIIKDQTGAKARVVVGDASIFSDIDDCARLDVITSEGWAFSLRIWHDREAVLLDRIIDDRPHVLKPLERRQDDTKNVKERRQAVRAKDVYLRRFIHAPKHHRAVLNLCHRYTAFAGTVRLAKRWFASHWFLGAHVSPEAVELICAKIYVGNGNDLGGNLDEGKDDRPGLPITKERGFSQVIKFLMEWQWEEGLIIPVYGSGEPINVTEATAVSDTSAWRLFTEEDRTGKMWTRNGPDAVVARRVTSFAKAAWLALEQGIITQNWDVKVFLSLTSILKWFSR
jgi:U3 small nucleolar RNA-associated protein 22